MAELYLNSPLRVVTQTLKDMSEFIEPEGVRNSLPLSNIMSQI